MGRQINEEKYWSRFLRHLQVPEEGAVRSVKVVQQLPRLVLRQLVRRAHRVQGHQPLSRLRGAFVVVRQTVHLCRKSEGNCVNKSAQEQRVRRVLRLGSFRQNRCTYHIVAHLKTNRKKTRKMMYVPLLALHARRLGTTGHVSASSQQIYLMLLSSMCPTTSYHYSTSTDAQSGKAKKTRKKSDPHYYYGSGTDSVTTRCRKQRLKKSTHGKGSAADEASPKQKRFSYVCFAAKHSTAFGAPERPSVLGSICSHLIQPIREVVN